MKKLTDDLKAVSKEINALSKKLDQLSKKADRLKKAAAVKKGKPKAAPAKKAVKKAKAAPARKVVKKKAAAKTVAPKKEAVKKTVNKSVKKPAGKPAVSATPTNKVLTFMKRYKKGVSISKLKERSGLSDKQISNILHRASKEGKIKRIARGVYQLA